MRKSLFLVAVLSLSSLAFAAKKYDLAFNGNEKVASVQFAKGNYTLKVDGDKVVITDEHYKAVTVTGKLQTGAKKFEYTSMETTEKNGAKIVTAIHLGGSTTTVEFAD